MPRDAERRRRKIHSRGSGGSLPHARGRRTRCPSRPRRRRRPRACRSRSRRAWSPLMSPSSATVMREPSPFGHAEDQEGAGRQGADADAVEGRESTRFGDQRERQALGRFKIRTLVVFVRSDDPRMTHGYSDGLALRTRRRRRLRLGQGLAGGWQQPSTRLPSTRAVLLRLRRRDWTELRAAQPLRRSRLRRRCVTGGGGAAGAAGGAGGATDRRRVEQAVATDDEAPPAPGAATRPSPRRRAPGRPRPRLPIARGPAAGMNRIETVVVPRRAAQQVCGAREAQVFAGRAGQQVDAAITVHVAGGRERGAESAAGHRAVEALERRRRGEVACRRSGLARDDQDLAGSRTAVR